VESLGYVPFGDDSEDIAGDSAGKFSL